MKRKAGTPAENPLEVPAPVLARPRGFEPLAFGFVAAALQWAAAGRRLAGKGAFGAASSVALPAGSGTEHLAALRHLVDQVTHRVLMGGNAERRAVRRFWRRRRLAH